MEYDGEDDAAPGDVTAINLQHRKYEIERKRIGANLNLDWRPDEDSRYYLRTLYSQFDDAETRQRVIFNFDDAKMVKTGTDQYRLDGMPKDSIDKRMRYRTKKENTFAASLGGENKLTNAVVDYRIGYTRTEERVNDEMEARFKLNGKAFNGSLDQSSRLPSYSFDNPQWLDNSNYAFDRFVLSPKQVNDRSTARRSTCASTATAAASSSVCCRWRDRDVNVDERELRVGPKVTLAGWTTSSPEHRHGNFGDGMDSAAMRAFWAANGSQYSARPQDVGGNAMTSLEEDYVASEDIFASYAMGTWDVGALRIIGGVRVENTRFKAIGNQVDVAANGRSFTVTRAWPTAATPTCCRACTCAMTRLMTGCCAPRPTRPYRARPSATSRRAWVTAAVTRKCAWATRNWIRTSRRTSTCRWRSTSAAAASFRWACSTSRSMATSSEPCAPMIRPTVDSM